MFVHGGLIHFRELVKPFVADHRFNSREAFAMRSGLHRLPQSPKGFNGLQCHQSFCFIFNMNRICHNILHEWEYGHYAKFATDARYTRFKTSMPTALSPDELLL